MASSSASSITNPKSSRFSTLKVFKFSSKDKSSKPPPLPPKDHYYLQNRSLASLSPDTLSIPPTSPLSPHSQYSRRPSPDMNQSSMSLVSSAASGRSYSPADAPHIQAQIPKRKGSGFFKFTKRSPKTVLAKSPPPEPDLPPPATEDDNISLPWNFQHNIHVDEGYTGLPPSWTTSLAKAGFTEEEIADIQNRRAAGTRSPGSQYLFIDRPASPAYSTNPSAPILTNPTPRTTSLPRQYSDASLGQPHRSPPPLPVSTLVTSPSTSSLQSNRAMGPNSKMTPPRRQFSTDQSSTHNPSSSISKSVDSHHSNSGSSFSQDANLGVSSPPSQPTQPSTPPRRMYHVANEISTMHSPPPSYSHFSGPNGNNHTSDRKDGSIFHQSSHASSVHSTPRSNTTVADVGNTPALSDRVRKGHHSHPSAEAIDDDGSATHSTSSSTSDSPSKTTPRQRAGSLSKRLTALPPRLSLHKTSDSTDLSTWGEALLSGISNASAEVTPNSSTFAAAQDVRPSLKETLSLTSAASPYSRSGPSFLPQLHGTRPSPPPQSNRNEEKTKPSRRPPPTRPIPPVVVDEGRYWGDGEHSFFNSGEDEAPPESAWAEPSMTARYDPSETWEGNETEQPTPSSEIASPLSLWSALEGIARNDSTRDNQIYSAALNETCSPTLPFSPNNGQEDSIKGRQQPDFDVYQEDGHDGFLSADGGRERTNRDSSRSSTSTVTELTKHPAIVRNASIARRAGAYVIDKSKVSNLRERDQEKGKGEGYSAASARSTAPRSSLHTTVAANAGPPPSPLSSNFGSEEGSASGSGSSSSLSQDHETPTTEAGLDSPLLYYLDSSPSPDPSKLSFAPGAHHHLLVSATDTFGGVHKEDDMADIDEEEDGEDDTESPNTSPPPISRPKIVISEVPSTSPATAVASAPLSPFQRYRGWLSAVVAPLEEFIDEAIDPRDYYLDLQEIAEGESGSVFAARLAVNNLHKLKLPPLIKAQDSDDLANGRSTLVAIKSVAILPSGSPKLVDLERELSLMKGLGHENILSMDAVYVDLLEDTLWIRMELMERSLADIIGLVGEGLMLHDRMIARFASDVLQALEYLQKHRIAHRDVRSDNLLLGSQGYLKLTDFSNAVQIKPQSPMLPDPAGVIYWQAPEVRTPPYNALKVDVWSLGATVWEMAQAEPPFADTQQISDRWPPLSQPEIYSPGFHDFLRQCSEPSASRPTPTDLKKSSFIHNACGRPVIIQLLSQCMAIERTLQAGDAT